MNKITEKFLERRGMTLVSGKGGDIMLPFFLAIIHWDIFAASLKGLGEKHELLRTKNLWRSKIQNFVNVAMNTYSLEEFDEEYMPEIEKFTSYIHNDLMLTKVAVSNCLSSIDDFKVKNVVSDIMLSNILIQFAEKMWKVIFHTSNIDLQAMDRLSVKYARLYYPTRENIDLNKSQALSDAVVNLCKKVLKYIDEEL